jgi:hypothetical protein
VGGEGWWGSGAADEEDSVGNDGVPGGVDPRRSEPGDGGRPGGLRTRIPEKIGLGSFVTGESAAGGVGDVGEKYGKTDSSNVT